MAVNNFVPGEILDATRLNELVSQINATEAAEAATNTIANTANGQASSTASALSGQKVETQVVLWAGNSYIDGSTNYNLWSSGLHQTWDVVRVYVAYDSQSAGGKGGHAFEILCGPGYNFNEQDSYAHSTLCTTYGDVYRRLCVTTNGLNVVNGNGAGWYLTKVVGVKYKTL